MRLRVPLSTPIGELRDWGLVVWCSCRGFPKHLAVERLVQELGTRPTLERTLGACAARNANALPDG